MKKLQVLALSVAIASVVAEPMRHARGAPGKLAASSRSPVNTLEKHAQVDLSARGGFKAADVIEPPFWGLRQDICHFTSTYGSELRDCTSVKVLSTVLFLFLGCLAPVIAFGGLSGAITQGSIGMNEMMLGTSFSGMAYALLAG